MQTPIEKIAMDKSSEEFAEIMQAVLTDLQAMFEAKGQDYDQLTPAWHRMVFGNISWAHEICKKSDRLASLISLEQSGGVPNFESLKDNVKDIAVYCVMWLAFMDLQASQIAELYNEGTTKPQWAPGDGPKLAVGVAMEEKKPWSAPPGTPPAEGATVVAVKRDILGREKK